MDVAHFNLDDVEPEPMRRSEVEVAPAPGMNDPSASPLIRFGPGLFFIRCPPGSRVVETKETTVPTRTPVTGIHRWFAIQLTVAAQAEDAAGMRALGQAGHRQGQAILTVTGADQPAGAAPDHLHELGQSDFYRCQGRSNALDIQHGQPGIPTARVDLPDDRIVVPDGNRLAEHYRFVLPRMGVG